MIPYGRGIMFHDPMRPGLPARDGDRTQALRGRMMRKIVSSAALALAGVMAACTSGEVALAPVEFEGMEDGETVVATARPMTLGNPDAPISIVEFGDFQCPGCGAFARQVKTQIELAYIDGGQVNFKFYDFPLITIHPHAFLASRASRCADDQGLYWEYHNALFQNQRAWSMAQSAPLGMFEDYAAEAGLDTGDFRSCLRSDEYAVQITANLQLANLLGVSSTPTVMISQGDGTARRLADVSFPSISEVVDEMLAELTAEGGQ